MRRPHLEIIGKTNRRPFSPERVSLGHQNNWLSSFWGCCLQGMQSCGKVKTPNENVCFLKHMDI